MSARLKNLTLNTDHLQEMVDFFSCLGIEMKSGKVEKGSKIFKASVGEVQLSLVSIPRGRKSSIPNMSLSMQIKNIEKAIGQLKKQPQVEILMDLEEIATTKVAIVIDPDGRSIEIFE